MLHSIQDHIIWLESKLTHIHATFQDDIINNGPKFNSIGYRFQTDNQNKYVTHARTPAQFHQTRYPYPYKRILLSKNPKDRIGMPLFECVPARLPSCDCCIPALDVPLHRH